MAIKEIKITLNKLFSITTIFLAGDIMSYYFEYNYVFEILFYLETQN